MKAHVKGNSRRLDSKPKISKSKEIQQKKNPKNKVIGVPGSSRRNQQRGAHRGWKVAQPGPARATTVVVGRSQTNPRDNKSKQKNRKLGFSNGIFAGRPTL